MWPEKKKFSFQLAWQLSWQSAALVSQRSCIQFPYITVHRGLRIASIFVSALLLSSVCVFFVYLFIYLFFLIECQATCFKNSSYLFSKSGRVWDNNNRACSDQKGYLVSIETEEEWQFINCEIQKRGTWNASAWHIGLEKKGRVWTWLSGETLNISKWRDSEPGGNDKRAEISKNGGLFNNISKLSQNAYICETPGGKITFQP